MLKVYAAQWCPHCKKTIAFLNERGIPFEYCDIEKASDDVVRKVVEVNGGDDWVVPTLELNGKWRPGKVFDSAELEKDLKDMGLEF